MSDENAASGPPATPLFHVVRGIDRLTLCGLDPTVTVRLAGHAAEVTCPACLDAMEGSRPSSAPERPRRGDDGQVRIMLRHVDRNQHVASVVGMPSSECSGETDAAAVGALVLRHLHVFNAEVVGS